MSRRRCVGRPAAWWAAAGAVIMLWQPACRAGWHPCCKHCPPYYADNFGYFATQWRPWPGVEPPRGPAGESSTLPAWAKPGVQPGEPAGRTPGATEEPTLPAPRQFPPAPPAKPPARTDAGLPDPASSELQRDESAAPAPPASPGERAVPSLGPEPPAAPTGTSPAGEPPMP